MKRKIMFCKNKFRTLLFTATFSMAIEYLMLLSDTIIVGNILGDNAIAGINLVTPLFGVAAFISTLISVGTSVCYSYEVGAFRKKQADGLFGQGVILAIGVGIAMFLIAFWGKEMYLDFFSPSTEVLLSASSYYDNYCIIVLLYPLYSLLVDMVYSDGDSLVCNISYAVQVIGNIVLSVLLCKSIGIAGASLGTLIGTILSLMVLLTHFFRKQNSLGFRWHISASDILRVVKFSIVDAGTYLYWAILLFAMSKFIISRFGDIYLPVLSVLTSLLELTIVYDGIGQAINPLISVYRGEKNSIGIRKTNYKKSIAK